jgi:hypothetical protein
MEPDKFANIRGARSRVYTTEYNEGRPAYLSHALARAESPVVRCGGFPPKEVSHAFRRGQAASEVILSSSEQQAGAR